MVQSVLAGEEQTLVRLARLGYEAAVVARAEEPFGPVMRARTQMLQAKGLLTPGQSREELIVVEAVSSRGAPVTNQGEFEDVA